MHRVSPSPQSLWTRSFRADLRFAARQFRRAPAYAVFTVLVLALGIGTVTAMFTIGYGVLFKPLPFRADRQLFEVVERNQKGDETYQSSYPEIVQDRDAIGNLAEFAFVSSGVSILDAPSGAELVSEVASSPNLFATLGVEPILGRAFSPSEQVSDHPDVVLISYDLWLRGFASDPHVLGKTVHIGGVLHTVVGVMPKHFEYPVYDRRAEVWIPLDRTALAKSGNGNNVYSNSYEPILRLHPGVRPQAVQAALANVHAQFSKENQIGLIRFRDLLVRDARPALLALAIAVAVLWLIACSNVAGLMLARVAARRSEIAVRSALGAQRHRIVAQFLTESLALSTVGASGGLALALAILRVFRHALQTMLPLAANIQLNWAVWIGFVVLTLLTALAFGTVPALLAARTGTQSGLRSGRKYAGDRSQHRARNILLIGEVALSIALLIGAGLMLRTMYALRHVPLGFRTDHLLLTSLTAPGDLYKDQNVGIVAWQPLLDELRRMPGVQQAAFSTVMPLKHPLEWLTLVYKTNWTQGNVDAVVRAASPGLMDVLGIAMYSGRFFDEGDTAASLPVTVVNRTFVNRYLGGNAIGKQIRFGKTPVTATIIGVIDDIHQESVAEPTRPEIYICIPQVASNTTLYKALLSRYMELAVRTEADPATMIGALRRTIANENPHLAIGEFTTMQAAVEDSIGAQKLAAGVVGTFGALALLITVTGLYGLLSFLVEQRTQEIGIRMALGADRSHVVGLILRQTLVLMGAGAGLGLALAFWSDRLLNGVLYGVTASDPFAMSLAPLALLLCGLLAAAIPARRAASVDPVVALRAE